MDSTEVKIRALHEAVIMLVWGGKLSCTQKAAQRSLLHLADQIERIFSEYELDSVKDPHYIKMTIEEECKSLQKNWGLNVVPIPTQAEQGSDEENHQP